MEEKRPGERLAEAAMARRTELGLTRQQVATRAENAGRRLSVSWLANVEKGRQDAYYPEQLEALDAALDWPSGTAKRHLSGQEPDDRRLSDRLARLEQDRLEKLVGVAVPASKLTDAEALLVVLGCLSDDQFAMFARAVQADDRFAAL